MPTLPEAPAGPPSMGIVDSEDRDGVLVRDVKIDGTIEAYLVEPAIVDARTVAPGLVFAHWFDTHAPNGNRTEFLDEAVDWIRARGGSAVLPQLTFPWASDPTGSAADRERIAADVAPLRRAGPGRRPARRRPRADRRRWSRLWRDARDHPRHGSTGGRPPTC